MANYNRYDTALVCLYALGRADLVPMHLRAMVPASTASAWRKLQPRCLVGHELRAMQIEALEMQDLLARHAHLRRTVCVVMKAWVGISDEVLPVIHKNKELVERVVSTIQLLFTVMPRVRVYRLAGLSASAFHERLARIKVRCGISAADRCFFRHPQQLSLRELDLIKWLHVQPSLALWPGSSLYYEGLRRFGLRIALSTFYKYTTLLGLKRKWQRSVNTSKGLQAHRPNEYLHVDTTHWALEHGVKASVVFVSDNFSKMILGWRVSIGKHAVHVVGALRDAVATIRQHHPQQACAVLVADGGGENHAHCVDDLLRATRHPDITKVIALKDIQFSNSAIEAINKIYKRSLRYHQPRTLTALQAVTEAFVQEYNSLRPHGSLYGLTPIEAYTRPGKQLDHKAAIQDARGLRIAANRKVNCAACRTPTD
jgi:transposase InsO family protein